MDLTTLIIFCWLIINTGATVVGIAMFTVVRRQFSKRSTDLDIKDQLHFVVQRLDREAIHRDRELREAVELLIKRLEADPLTRERHIIDITAIKDRLRA